VRAIRNAPKDNRAPAATCRRPSTKGSGCTSFGITPCAPFDPATIDPHCSTGAKRSIRVGIVPTSPLPGFRSQIPPASSYRAVLCPEIGPASLEELSFRRSSLRRCRKCAPNEERSLGRAQTRDTSKWRSPDDHQTLTIDDRTWRASGPEGPDYAHHYSIDAAPIWSYKLPFFALYDPYEL